MMVKSGSSRRTGPKAVARFTAPPGPVQTDFLVLGHEDNA